jgi:tetratricopeptide (TPR) repeat protein
LRAKIPGKAVDEYERALKESSKGNRVKAAEGLERALKLAPDFYEAQHSLGIQYIGLQKYDQAETALLRARDLSPKAAEPLINLGTLYYQRGESHSDAGRAEEAATTFEKAEDVLEESIRRNPLSSSAHFYLGATRYKMGSYEEAETSLKRALELNADEQNARLMLVNVYTKSARYNEALEQTNIFLAKNPKSPQRAALEALKEKIEKAAQK